MVWAIFILFLKKIVASSLFNVKEARSKEDYSVVENVGIDETSSKKGHD